MSVSEPQATSARQPHAVLDLASRRLKAMKIERLLGLGAQSGPLRLLEVGTGSGGIAHYFANHADLRLDVHAVDVVDNRLEREGYRFHLVNDVVLPFASDSFDVVISNHVIEHVGERSEQLEHLRQVRRVMRPGSVGYLAVPNRWRLVEPHYKAPLLSCLPPRWRTPFLRLLRRGRFYDCEPLTYWAAQAMLREVALEYTYQGVAAVRATIDIEHAGSQLARIAARVPDTALSWLNPWFATLIFRLRKPL